MLSFLISLFVLPSVHADVYAYPDRELHISAAVQRQEYSLQLRDDASGQDLFYKPNVGAVLVPRISYKSIWTLSWGFNTPVEESEKALNGTTSFTDIRFDFALHSFTVNAYYSQYRGLFLDNSQDVDPSITENDPKIQRPDMYSRKTGVAITWVWDDASFSLPNLINQAERQEKRGGSFLFGGGISESVVTADSNFIPSSLQSDFDILASLRGARFQTLSAKAGYGYAFARKWYFGGAILVGPGLTYRQFEFDNRPASSGWEPSAVADLLLAGGYNGDKYFIGTRVDWRQDFYLISGSSSQINPQLLAVTFNFGMHLSTLNW